MSPFGSALYLTTQCPFDEVAPRLPPCHRLPMCPACVLVAGGLAASWVAGRAATWLAERKRTARMLAVELDSAAACEPRPAASDGPSPARVDSLSRA